MRYALLESVLGLRATTAHVAAAMTYTLVGHIGTSVPLQPGWLLVDWAGRRWWVPALTAVILAWNRSLLRAPR